MKIRVRPYEEFLKSLKTDESKKILASLESEIVITEKAVTIPSENVSIILETSNCDGRPKLEQWADISEHGVWYHYVKSDARNREKKLKEWVMAKCIFGPLFSRFPGNEGYVIDH